MSDKAPDKGSARKPLLCGLLDDGLCTAAENVARDLQIASGPPTLRFSRYPISAVLGANERAAIAVRGDYCAEQKIAVVRRATGGGALYQDPTQLCWALSLPADHLEPARLAGVLERHGRAVVAALRQLGVTARFVFPNDVEAQGRKLGSGFAVRRGRKVLLQGSLLVGAPDVESMLKILRVPTEKLSREGVLSARERLTSVETVTGRSADFARIRAALTDALGKAFGLTFAADRARNPATPWAVPAPLLDRPTEDAMKAFVKTPGGAIYLSVEVDAQGNVADAVFSGAVQFSPDDLFVRLAKGLVGQRLDDCAEALRTGFRKIPDADLLGFGLDDLLRVLALALARRSQAARFGLTCEQSNSLIVHSPGGEAAESILERATVMLVPYCAKLADCKFRFRDGCSECGKCEVGDAYAMARERGMRVISITNFEHLQETLTRLRADEVPAYVGMCCESFYLKRHYAFQEAGIPAVLTDISGATCYELREEDLAYAGRFRAEAHLKLDVVERVMRFVPPRRALEPDAPDKRPGPAD